jgi:hypothetical protein
MIHVEKDGFEACAGMLLSNVCTSLACGTRNRCFHACFGETFSICAALWSLCLPFLPTGTLPIHLLWVLYFLKVYTTENHNASVAGVDEKTFRKWTWIVVYAIAAIPDLVRNTFLLHFSWLVPSLSSLIAAITSVTPSRFVQFSLTVEMYFSHCAFVTTDCLG